MWFSTRKLRLALLRTAALGLHVVRDNRPSDGIDNGRHAEQWSGSVGQWGQRQHADPMPHRYVHRDQPGR